MTTAPPTPTTPTAGVDKRARSTTLQRLSSLAQAEWLQFRRNKTLLFMATVFPVGIPLVLFFLGDATAMQAANASEDASKVSEHRVASGSRSQADAGQQTAGSLSSEARSAMNRAQDAFSSENEGPTAGDS